MAELNWSLLQQPDYGRNALLGYTYGQEAAQDMADRAAEAKKLREAEQRKIRRRELVDMRATNPSGAITEAMKDPEMADLVTQFQKLGEDERAETTRQAEEGAKALIGLKSVPPEQRMQAAAQWGLPAEQLGDLSDAFIDREVYKAMSLKDIFAEQNRQRDDNRARQRDEEMQLYREGMLGIRQGQLDLSRQREGRVASGGGRSRGGGGGRAAPKPPAGFILD